MRDQKIAIGIILNLNFMESLRKCFEEQAFYRLRILTTYNILDVFKKIMFFINNSKDVEYYEVKKYNTRNKNGIAIFINRIIIIGLVYSQKNYLCEKKKKIQLL